MFNDFGYAEEDKLGKPYDIRLFRKLYPFVRPYNNYIFWAVFLIVVITIMELCLPLVLKRAIDSYIVPESASAADVSERGDPVRYLDTDMSDPKIREIVSRYQDLFETDNNSIRIKYKELEKLEKEDLLILRQNDLYGVTRMAGLYLLIIALVFVFHFIHMMIMEYIGQKIMHGLRIRLYTHIQALSVSFFTRNPVGRLVTRVTSDVQNMHELFTSIISVLFKDIFLLIGIAGVLAYINWKLALITFSILPFVAYASLIFSGRSRKIFRLLRVKVAEINTKMSESIGGMRAIQLFRKERLTNDDFIRLNHDNFLISMRQIRIMAIFMPIIEFCSVLATALVIYYGGRNVLQGSISLGALVAFISYMKMFFRPIRDISEKYNILQNAMASAERIFLLLDEKDRLPEPASTVGPVFLETDPIRKIEFNRVCFSYIKGVPVVEDISFTIPAGESLAIVGPTGSGKTTLINLILRFYDPDSGSILINGHDIRESHSHKLRNRMALVMQDPFLFSGTIRDNICRGRCDLSGKEMTDILKASSCYALVEKLSNGVDTELGEGGVNLSSGERQLVSIARAFARNPELIILDEATSYIDTETEQQIQGAFLNLMKNRTSIIIAHRLSTARNANRILVLYNGRIIESGSHDELMDEQGFYFRLNQLNS
ncbi:MAG: ABC transporter ATP-binding protein [Deltaproteobacteria bacterium]|nr:ABC transporter ATP-binding protein [Deltaproteobacteria bacterium]